MFVIDAKNWSGGRLRLDGRGMALGRYRRDDELHAARADGDLVARHTTGVVSDGAPTTGVLVFVGDVGLAQPVHHQQVVLLGAGQLLGWLTSQPARLTPQQVHQLASTLDAALPPRSGPRRPLVLPDQLAARRLTGARRPPAGRRRPAASQPARRNPSKPGATPAPGLRRSAARVLLAVLLFLLLPAAVRVGAPLLTHLLQTTSRPQTHPTPPTGAPPGRRAFLRRLPACPAVDRPAGSRGTTL